MKDNSGSLITICIFFFGENGGGLKTDKEICLVSFHGIFSH